MDKKVADSSKRRLEPPAPIPDFKTYEFAPKPNGGKYFWEMTRGEMRRRYKWGMNLDNSHEDDMEKCIKWALKLTPEEWERWRTLRALGFKDQDNGRF